MSIDQNRRTLNQLDKELADFEKKLADVVRKEADKTKRINDTQKSITKNTSSSMLQSKLRQIQEYQNDLVKISNNKADINKKIADKRKKRSDTAIKLQKEEAEEGKKASREQQKIYDAYERRISDLNNQIAQTLIKKPTAPTSLYHDTHDMEEYDVFISHASEVKESFANALNRDYIKKGWTQYELDGLFQREMTDGKTILPIWHNITKQEVENFSPTLAGRLALNSASMTPIEIADELKKILRISDNEQEDQNNA